MKILTKSEGLDWLRTNGLPTDGSELRFFHKSYIAYEFHNPPLTTPQIMLADGLIQEILQLEG
ncbi:MAG TPA: hypothetical protein VFR02_05495, partial [bacterium]|nr:hypothetical protein [bacterium]